MSEPVSRLSAALSDRYRIERELGAGGMATVYLADDLRHDRRVAIKVLRPELAGAIGVDRFVREVRLTANLQHPNIVPVLDSGILPAAFDGPPLPWYAMPYIAGESLRGRLNREHQLPVEDAVHIAEQVANALEAAHTQGVVHRDIKPENVILAGSAVYVVDFGIAKALIDTGGEQLTSTGFAIGTPVYMSPEQATASPVDARTDQYGLATMLYEMLAGEPPFTGPNPQAIVGRRFAEAARAIRPVRPTVPVTLERAVLRGLERVPADRFTDVRAFTAALRSTAMVEASAPRRRGRLVPLISGVALLAILVAGGAWAYRRQRPGAAPAARARDSLAVALYQRGVREYDRRTPAGAVASIAAFSGAIQRDSAYGPAWTGLARTYVRAFERRFEVPGVPRDSILRLAVAAAQQALAADSGSAAAWLAEATVARQITPTDLTTSLRAVRRSLRLDSTSAPAWQLLGINLAESGDMGAATEAFQHSVRADPRYTQGIAFLTLAHYWHRQYDSAAVWADSAVSLDPSYILGWDNVAEVAVERGDFARARAGFDAARRLSTNVEVVNAEAGIALAAARAGRATEARALLRQAEAAAATYQHALHTDVYLAQVHAALGEAAQAVHWLRQYEPVEDLHFQLHLRCDPPFDPIAKDARFRALLTATLPRGRGC